MVTVCDISAFQYWRTPPVARLLVSAPEDDPQLRAMVSPARLRAFREELAESVPLLRALANRGQSRARYGPDALALAAAVPLLAAGSMGPIDVHSERPGQRRPSALVRPRVCAGVSSEPAYGIAPGVSVVAPQLALQQLCARASLVQTVMLATEVCGGFSVYDPPEPVRRLLNELLAEGRLPRIAGWEPSLDMDGRLTSLWTRPALLTPARMLSHARSTGVRRGRARLELAARLTVPGAASPFEARTGILLGFSSARGGEGYAGFSHNARIGLSGDARRLARRGYLACDLYWPAAEGRRALDLECQSGLVHGGSAAALSDADRTAALQLMETEVVLATYGQIADAGRFDALSRLVAQKLGVSYHVKSPEQRDRALKLRQEVFQSWEELPLV